jgi:hypothetical protein
MVRLAVAIAIVRYKLLIFPESVTRPAIVNQDVCENIFHNRELRTPKMKIRLTCLLKPFKML